MGSFDTTNGPGWTDAGRIGPACGVSARRRRRRAVGALFALATAAGLCRAQDGTWALQHPTLTCAGFYDVQFVDTAYGWAVGANGTVAHSRDGGRSWALQRTPKDNDLRSVCFLSRDTGWAVGGVKGRGYALRTFDGGATWREVPALQGTRLDKVLFRNRSRGWTLKIERLPPEVGRASTNMYATTDGGEHWDSLQICGALLLDMAIVDDTTVVAVGDMGYVMRSTDDGRTWSRATVDGPGAFMRVRFPCADTGYCLAVYDMYRTVDRGLNWNLIVQPTHAYDMFFFNSRQGVLYEGSRVWLTSTAGTSWENLAPPVGLQTPYGGCWYFPDADSGLLLSGAKIYKVHGVATSATELTDVGPGDGLYSIDFCDTLHGAAGSVTGGVMTTDDGGESWVWRTTPTTSAVREVLYFDHANLLIFYGDSCARSADGGATWHPAPAPVSVAISESVPVTTNMRKRSTANAFIHQDRRVVLTADGGHTWVEAGSGLNSVSSYPDIASVTFIDEGHAWAVNFAGVVLRTSDTARTWDTVGLVEGTASISSAFDIHFLDSLNGWVAGCTATIKIPRIWRTKDGGRTWSKQDTIHYIMQYAKPTDLPPVPYSKLTHIVALDTLHVWALAYSHYGVLASSDGGRTWQQQPLPCAGFKHLFNDMCVLPSRRVWVCGLENAVWAYRPAATAAIGPDVLHPEPNANSPRHMAGVMFDLRGRQVFVSGCEVAHEGGAVAPGAYVVPLPGAGRARNRIVVAP